MKLILVSGLQAQDRDLCPEEAVSPAVVIPRPVRIETGEYV